MTLRKTTAIALMLFVVLTSSAFNGFTLVKAELWDENYVIQTTVTYSNNGTTDWNLTEEDQAISLFMNNTWQTVYLSESSWPVERMKTDEDGNPMAVLRLPKSLEPGKSVTYKASYNVESRARSIPYLDEENSWNLTRIPEDLRDVYCRSGDAWQINDPTLREAALTIAEKDTNVLSVVKKFITWIWNHISYGSYEGPRYPNETLSGKIGDCDDQAILLITFCRICGIPSYLQVGCIYEFGSMMWLSSWNGTVTSFLKQIAWHGWAMVYIPPWEWLPVDLTYVSGGQGDPLNAIRTGAATSRGTIQYMNISQREYVASTRKYRDFLVENRIHVHQEDEMSLAFLKFLEESIKMWFPWFLIAVGIITGTLTAVFGYVWKVERQRLKA